MSLLLFFQGFYFFLCFSASGVSLMLSNSFFLKILSRAHNHFSKRVGRLVEPHFVFRCDNGVVVLLEAEEHSLTNIYRDIYKGNAYVWDLLQNITETVGLDEGVDRGKLVIV